MAQQRSGRVGLIFAAALIAGLYMTRDSVVNEPAPGFSLPETYGGRVDLESYKGRPVLLVFWTTSCGICRRELPLVSRIAPEFRRKGIAVMAIHLGEGDEAREYMRASGVAVTSLVDADGAVAQAYRVSGVPKLVLIGADGKIKRASDGMAGEGTLRDWIDVVSPS